ncbi:MAG: hypothetical protein L3J20_06320 [Flavobacteriaceae bacterium]|nr:hypothetical protein [Flavobacteriaceae bacterium]
MVLKIIAILKNSSKDYISCSECFEFDQYHWLVKGEQEVKVKIPGFYMVESKQSIIQTDRDG